MKKLAEFDKNFEVSSLLPSSSLTARFKPHGPLPRLPRFHLRPPAPLRRPSPIPTAHVCCISLFLRFRQRARACHRVPAVREWARVRAVRYLHCTLRSLDDRFVPAREPHEHRLPARSRCALLWPALPCAALVLCPFSMPCYPATATRYANAIAARRALQAASRKAAGTAAVYSTRALLSL